jgi:CelD/BcsL family acetyltransferase involved in cellulose biosynthesis
VSAPRIDILTSVEEFRALETEWNAFHAEAGGTVFQGFHWLWNWWDIYGCPTCDLHIITARVDGRLTAILPMYRQSSGFFPLRLSRLRLIGVYETYGEYEILVGPRFALESERAIARHLAGMLMRGDLDLISFFRFSPESASMDLLVQALRIRELRSRFVPHVITRVTMDLPPTWEGYLSRLSPNERQSLRRKMRFFEGDGMALERVTAPDPRAFADYVRLHTSSWEERKLRGYFASPDFRTFLERVTESMMREGRARLYFLSKDGVRFAAVHAFFVNGTCCFYLSGLDRKHPLASRSPGKVLLAMVIRDAIAEGCSIFDFQGGDEDYKFQLGGRGTSFAKAMFWRGGVRSAKVVTFLAAQYIAVQVGWRFRERIVPFFRKFHPKKALTPVRHAVERD